MNIVAPWLSVVRDISTLPITPYSPPLSCCRLPSGSTTGFGTGGRAGGRRQWPPPTATWWLAAGCPSFPSPSPCSSAGCRPSRFSATQSRCTTTAVSTCFSASATRSPFPSSRRVSCRDYTDWRRRVLTRWAQPSRRSIRVYLKYIYFPCLWTKRFCAIFTLAN